MTKVEVDNVVCYVHASDGITAARLVFLHPQTLSKLTRDPAFAHTSLQRAHRVALASERLPLRLNPSWSPYHYANYVAFFAVPRDMGAFRWIAQIRILGTDDVCFWELNAPTQPVVLERFRPSLGRYRTTVGVWEDALQQAKKRFARVQQTEKVGVSEAIDLDATTFGAVTGHRSYSAWMERLTDDQLRFLEKPITASVRLRGPAGTGKTLLLELKALRELYQARDTGRRLRILYVTHSWAMAIQVDAALRELDESGDLDGIDVLPLLAIAQELLPSERQAGRGFELLGEDNLSGKLLQLRELQGIVNRFVEGDWLCVRREVPAELCGSPHCGGGFA